MKLEFHNSKIGEYVLLNKLVALVVDDDFGINSNTLDIHISLLSVKESPLLEGDFPLLFSKLHSVLLSIPDKLFFFHEVNN